MLTAKMPFLFSSNMSHFSHVITTSKCIMNWNQVSNWGSFQNGWILKAQLHYYYYYYYLKKTQTDLTT
jgi:hypothetical protein